MKGFRTRVLDILSSIGAPVNLKFVQSFALPLDRVLVRSHCTFYSPVAVVSCNFLYGFIDNRIKG